MKKRLGLYVVLSLVAGTLVGGAASRSAEKNGAQLAHIVFFTLKDHSSESRERFVASCRKYLPGHPGTLYFSIGTVALDVKEPVSVTDFDVAVHIVFTCREAKLTYEASPRHLAFVAANTKFFQKVRVFDSYLVPHGQVGISAHSAESGPAPNTKSKAPAHSAESEQPRDKSEAEPGQSSRGRRVASSSRASQDQKLKRPRSTGGPASKRMFYGYPECHAGCQ